MAPSPWALPLLLLALLFPGPPLQHSQQGWLAAAQSTRKVLRPDMNQGPRRAQSDDGSGGSASSGAGGSSLDPAGFPGTATQRMNTALSMIANLTQTQLDGDWGDIRRSLLQSCGLTDSRNAVGRGRTTHCFADCASCNPSQPQSPTPCCFLSIFSLTKGCVLPDNHVDCCAMQAALSHNENAGRVAGMHRSNQLGPGITASSIESHGEGGSWCTCHIGAGRTPPRDVCHVQFESRISFKLVWCPGPQETYERYVIVDDDGALLATGESSLGLLLRLAFWMSELALRDALI